jgi:hypothetical protein
VSIRHEFAICHDLAVSPAPKKLVYIDVNGSVALSSSEEQEKNETANKRITILFMRLSTFLVEFAALDFVTAYQ